jgi:spoIIIJ-associated protein
MENLEITAKTVEEATKKALTRLNAGLDEVEITILNEGKGGILGIGAEDAKISVHLREPVKSDDTVAIEEAKQILEDLLVRMGMQATVDIKESGNAPDNGEEANPVILNVVGDDLGVLIGRRGQTIDAVQYLVRLILSRKTRSKVPIMVDVEDYKQHRYDDLRTLAMNVGSQVKARKTSIRLEPMTAFERRIIHMTLANDPEVATESIGEGESRKVVVMPKGRK